MRILTQNKHQDEAANYLFVEMITFELLFNLFLQFNVLVYAFAFDYNAH